jgi:hypothetical protein
MPSVDSIDGWNAVHRILPPTEDYNDIRIKVSPHPDTGSEVKYFETPDLETLLEALKYGDTFPFARQFALKAVRDVVGVFRDGIWRPRMGETFDEWVSERQQGLEGDERGDGSEDTGVRREVWGMVRLLCVQEGRLLDEMSRVLSEEIPGGEQIE